jgi:hypothetical protein
VKDGVNVEVDSVFELIKGDNGGSVRRVVGGSGGGNGG